MSEPEAVGAIVRRIMREMQETIAKAGGGPDLICPMDESFIEFASAKAVRENPDLAIKELVRLTRREAELEQEIANLRESSCGSSPD